MQSARRLLRRAHRKREGAFLVEGPTLIAEALAGGVGLRDVFVTERAMEEGAVPEVPADTPVWVVGDDVVDLIGETSTPQGMVAVADDPSKPIEALTGHDLVLVLASVRDPGNAGTLVRSALGAGAKGVVFTTGTVDPLGPKVVRAAAGALFHLDIVRDVSLEDAAEALRAAGSKIVGTDASSPTAPEDVDLTGAVTFVLGNEAWGLPADATIELDGTVGIPMPGPAESLNVAVAGSILMFEAVRQRRTRGAEEPA